MKIILPTNYYDEVSRMLILQELPSEFDVDFLKEPTIDELLKKAKKADYFLAGGKFPINEQILNVSKNLKMIQRTGVGIDKFDIEAIRKRNIPIYVNSGVNSQSVAEHTLLLILAVLRNLIKADTTLRKSEWLKHEIGHEGLELYNKTIGLIGTGNIGLKVAKILQGFNVNILYYDITRLSLNTEKNYEMQYCKLNELLSKADIVSLHCPLTDKTVGLISERELRSMKAGSILINTSRGKLIEETALIKYIKSGHLKGAGLDVYEQEPLLHNHPFISFENIVLTPHIGGVTSDSFRKMIREGMKNIKLFNAGQLDEIADNRIEI